MNLRLTIRWALLASFGLAGWVPFAALADEPPTAPIPAAEAVKHVQVPKGFSTTLFAGEPDVVQPIAFTWDDRGRMWVVECLSYPNWNGPRKDRVVILEDTDGDGKADSRKVFWDQGMNLTGIELGFGGVWLCATPNLIFVPDADHDDKPDGEAVTKLDGWDITAKHNVFNSLVWGPDGWLYGCNGILSNSLVGKPGTPPEQRTKLNCGVWRYHPVTQKFEVVMHGSTNPWGLDYNDEGEFFITNCVIEHLWHVIPGGHVKRMFGQDLVPYTYSFMDTVADHIHWGGGHWTEARGGEKHDSAGGGHAHCGGAIYLGDNFPPEYRNRVFMCNIHGNRVNQDSLHANGSTYIAKHEKDFFFANDPWFRGTAVHGGPDGGLYISDWSDTGECHNYIVADQSNGRIFRVVYGETKYTGGDLSRLSDAELVKLQAHKNDWYVRHARRLLQERAVAGKLEAGTVGMLEKMVRARNDGLATIPYNPIWTLHSIGAMSDQTLGNASYYGVRLLGDDAERLKQWLPRLEQMSRNYGGPVPSRELASILQRLSIADRWNLVERLAVNIHAKDATNQHMLWYGMEPLVLVDSPRVLKLASDGNCLALIRQNVARRLLDRPTPEESAAGLNLVIAAVAASDNPAVQSDLLAGVQTALAGRRKVPLPEKWADAYPKLLKGNDPYLAERATRLALIFGDPQAVTNLRGVVLDASQLPERRNAALSGLVDARLEGLAAFLIPLTDDSVTAVTALRGLGSYADKNIPGEILARYAKLDPRFKSEAIAALTTRVDFAEQLLAAVEKNQIPRADLSAYHVAQLNSLQNKPISERIEAVWGKVTASPQDRLDLMASYKQKLAGDALKAAKLGHGRAVFKKNCASCHTLFDEGGKIGPELTGAQRTNLDYVLSNVIDPSAVVAKDFQLTLIVTDDGRVLSGIVKQQTDLTLTLQTTTELITLPKSEISTQQQQAKSMMPDGLLRELSDDDIRDLVGYLASPQQVPVE